MGPKVGRKRQHHRIRDNSRKARTRARTRDLDQIFDDIKKPLTFEQDTELPGLGQFYCHECARHFISLDSLTAHKSTKLHKKRVKVLLTEKPYTQKEADAAAGLF
jgi:bud site selection protein 20